jgi:ABC-type Mn2+/Zn2+ transport system permease subunit
LSFSAAALSSFQCALLTAAAMSAACAVLSVIVVLRRWAFIGEGISHAGFGGIGTGWLLSLAFPALANSGAAYGVAILFCLAVALCMGYVSREHGGRGNGVASGDERFGADSAIGIFLVASLAWGAVALSLYNRHRHGASAQSWESYLLGTIEFVSFESTLAAVAISAAVVFTVAALFKEILFYALDPLMARVGGVRTGAIHYLLMLLLAMTIIVGMRIAGQFLIPAMLILPGATALALSRQLRAVMSIAVFAALGSAVAGVVLNHRWPFLQSGPMIVLVLFGEFLAAYAWSRVPRRKVG